jgi:hypothetical protein
MTFKLHYLLSCAVLSFFLASCSENSESDSQPLFGIEQTEDETHPDGQGVAKSEVPMDDVSKMNECEQALIAYEAFAIRYSNAIKKYQADPSNMTHISDYTQVKIEASDWKKKKNPCSSSTEYAQRYNAITTKIQQSNQTKVQD